MTRRESYNPLLKNYPDSEKVNAVSEGAEVLYTRLIAQSDDKGRFYGAGQWVLAKLFTARMIAGQLTESEVESRLVELEKVDLIRRYEVEGQVYLEMVNCFKKLRADVKPYVVFPAPLTELVPYSARTRPVSVTDSFHQPNPTQPKYNPEPTSVVSTELASQRSVPATDEGEPSEFTFPTTGKGPKTWTLPLAKLQEYRDAYPSLNVDGEMRKALQYVRDHAAKRKTAGGMLGYLTRWLNRATDRDERLAIGAPRTQDRPLPAWKQRLSQ